LMIIRGVNQGSMKRGVRGVHKGILRPYSSIIVQ
jgi:hypothetical protein